MGRAGLHADRKFLRLAQALNGISGGMGEIMARGALELLWSAAYVRADDWIGDASDVEIAACWRGESGALTALLVGAGGDGIAGFIEHDAERHGYRVHDLWDHAPPWVRRRAEGEAARRAAGKTLADVRREAGAKGAIAANEIRLLANPSPGEGRGGKGRDQIAAGAAAGGPKRKRQAPEAPPLPFSIAAMCDVIREHAKGQILVDPFDSALAKSLTAAIRSLAEAGCTLDDIRLAAEYAAVIVPTWTGFEPLGLSWLATTGKLSTMIARARAWHARGRALNHTDERATALTTAARKEWRAPVVEVAPPSDEVRAALRGAKDPA